MIFPTIGKKPSNVWKNRKININTAYLLDFSASISIMSDVSDRI
jgi:hypothetical protein